MTHRPNRARAMALLASAPRPYRAPEPRPEAARHLVISTPVTATAAARVRAALIAAPRAPVVLTLLDGAGGDAEAAAMIAGMLRRRPARTQVEVRGKVESPAAAVLAGATVRCAARGTEFQLCPPARLAPHQRMTASALKGAALSMRADGAALARKLVRRDGPTAELPRLAARGEALGVEAARACGLVNVVTW